MARVTDEDHLLAVTAVGADEVEYTIFRLDGDGNVIWKRLLERQARPERGTFGLTEAPVVATAPSKIIVAHGGQTIDIHTLDPRTGKSLEETIHGPNPRNHWSPVTIALAANHYELVARNCSKPFGGRCSLTSFRGVGQVPFAEQPAKLELSNHDIFLIHHWTTEDAGRVIFVHEFSDWETTWWVMDMVPNCPRHGPSLPRPSADLPLPY
jgi:hypothetical protein